MLGWFKKKLSRKKKLESAAVEEIAVETDIGAVGGGAYPLEEVAARHSTSSTSSESVKSTQGTVEPESRGETLAQALPLESVADEVGQNKRRGEEEQEKPQRQSMFKRLQERLGKSKSNFVHRLDTLFLGKKKIDQELLDELEEILITADLGVSTAMDLLDAAKDSVKRDELSDPQALKGVLRDKILSFLLESDRPAELVLPKSGPFVIMVVGVNGVGKTTSIG
ncbi:MAG: hypothetical protein D3924_18145, partial [Candidatus Electrothrix sp. AR4]|nr:hypothetical protein [Candidatus Electrothrix sp. AR4]